MECARALFEPTTNRAINYGFSKPPESVKRPVALFGTDPNEGFGLDWANYRQAHPKPFGPVPVEHENIHGHVPADSRPLQPPEKPYEDPAISHIHTRTSESTDQRVIAGDRDGNIEWDGIVRNKPKHDWQGVRGKSEPTEGDKAAKDLKTWDFDFSA